MKIKQISQRCLTLFFAVLLLAGSQVAWADKGCGYETFSDPNGSNNIFPAALNDSEMITGSYFDSNGGHAFVRDKKDGMTSFDAPGAVPFNGTRALGINNKGVIVGFYDANGGSFFPPFIRDKKGTFSSFDVPDSIFSDPAGINNNGVIAGNTSQEQGFVRDKQGVVTLFYVVAPGAPFVITRVNGINEKGDTVGYYLAAGGIFKGFVRSADGTFTLFDFSSDVNDVFLQDINDKGEAVGYYYDSNFILHRFFGKEPSAIKSFDVPGAVGTIATTINNEGVIAGLYVDADFIQHIFVRTHDGEIIVLAPPDAVNVPPRIGRFDSLQNPVINNNGSVVGNYYINTNRDTKGFLWTCKKDHDK